MRTEKQVKRIPFVLALQFWQCCQNIVIDNQQNKKVKIKKKIYIYGIVDGLQVDLVLSFFQKIVLVNNIVISNFKRKRSRMQNLIIWNRGCDGQIVLVFQIFVLDQFVILIYLLLSL
eukprot:TRINITY_DN24603_c0_g1_i6.p3 TRINITY_DN24603_c0_g1~~TRINITY_DN24603_c0_g1_i6.p3  ORF type:complete len:117 (-),score=1.19 TRINITY_DN24603_c0_g1_i6:80-430(-)